ncbi:Mur ligase [Amylocarpus encephaloides]|uniref:Folylpolyglutamate synthase n=1 Tax=Amylocarpus encephaloides TaxID=45428 RepID=A0A9P7YIX6_9HELO|nr:Mur ligase [Amylocarpus encephaloides]
MKIPSRQSPAWRTGQRPKAYTVSILPRYTSQRWHSVLQNRSYDDAINTLNTLQTTYAELTRRRLAGIRFVPLANDHLRVCLSKVGYSQDDLTKLNIVHVAGTKGKGSTCAYVDSMLSQYRHIHSIPQNIGLFTSPHLIAVRERIKINSTPISCSLFAKYFFEIYDALRDFEKPVYFKFLVLMSYHVFIQQGVDVAIYEAGVGGEYDATNIVDCPAVTGISRLGIDHTFQLGETVEEIAWHKAGIQKFGVPSFSVTQLKGALEVLGKVASERKVKNFEVKGWNERLRGVRVRPDAEFQYENASLAVALTESVLGKLDPGFKRAPDEPLSKELKDGIEKVVWRGRFEVKREGNITWYLDGAHTSDSIQFATKWYSEETSKKFSDTNHAGRTGTRVLVFNQQGHREAMELLETLSNSVREGKIPRFDHVIFAPTVLSQQQDLKKGNVSFALIEDHKADKLQLDFVNKQHDGDAIAKLTLQTSFAAKWSDLNGETDSQIKVVPSIPDAFDYIRDLTDGNGIEVFVTGSIHLVGTVLSALEGVDAL